jgi:hypothetical protein
MEPSSTEKLLYPLYTAVDSGTIRAMAERIMQLQASFPEDRKQGTTDDPATSRRQSTWTMIGGGRKSDIAAGVPSPPVTTT